jgi:hypothetical protein
MRYQHATKERDRPVADALSALAVDAEQRIADEIAAAKALLAQHEPKALAAAS